MSVEVLEVRRNLLVYIAFKRKPVKGTLNASVWFNNEIVENVPLQNNVLVVPNEKGIYIYGISANWEKGSAGYVFSIEVN